MMIIFGVLSTQTDLHGTTVDRDAEKSTGYYLSSEAWVGGAELGKYGCVGMSIAAV